MSEASDSVDPQNRRGSEDNEGRPDKGADGESFLPDQDAGPTDAEKYSRDEKDHGRQDYGP